MIDLDHILEKGLTDATNLDDNLDAFDVLVLACLLNVVLDA